MDEERRQRSWELGMEGLVVRADYLLDQSEKLFRWAQAVNDYLQQLTGKLANEVGTGFAIPPTLYAVDKELRERLEDWKRRNEEFKEEVQQLQEEEQEEEEDES